ncbi:MAG: helix-turn-helix transcriptional regulator [Bdellovibrionales bacterium]|nr:helix-turn-helix transcriptional regulator [Bdellovibrionales bacterium]MCB0384823.1 helix-turn-helix transcriptional regulator [Bdellovibrionales bacterium]
MKTILSDEEIEQILGENIKALRLQKNILRQKLCSQAGVSLTALKNLEMGKGTTLKTLVKVARALGRQDWLTALAPTATINPLHMVKEEPKRQRASKRSKNSGKK